MLRVLELTAILGLTALLCEGALRVLHHFHPIFIFPNDNYNVWRARPGSQLNGIRANSSGFADEEVQTRKPAGTCRILGLGDSFAFGRVPNEYNFLTILDDLLDTPGAPVEVVNMGIPRNAPHHYLALLRTEGLDLDPDAVLVNFFIGNDFKTRVGGEQLAARDRGSYLAASFRYLFSIYPRYEGRVFTPQSGDEPTLTEEHYRAVLARKELIFRKDAPVFLDTFQAAVEVVATIEKLCDRAGARMLVVLLPDEVQVEPKTRRQMLDWAGATSEDDYDFDLPNQMLLEALAERSIDTLDLLPFLRQAALAEPVYRPRDTHWNRLGNRIAAEKIAERVRELGWTQ